MICHMCWATNMLGQSHGCHGDYEILSCPIYGALSINMEVPQEQQYIDILGLNLLDEDLHLITNITTYVF